MTPGILEVLGGLDKKDSVPTIEHDLGRLEIGYRWADSKAAMISGFINIAMGAGFVVPILFISKEMLGGGVDPSFLLFTSFFYVFAGFFIYNGAARLLNHGTIIVDGEALVSYDRPLPLNLTKRVPTSNIKRVYASYIVKNSKQGSYRVHLLRVMTNDGRDRIVDTGISEENAQLFASEISKHLRLAEGPFADDLAKVTKEPGKLAIEYQPKEYATSTNLGTLLFAVLWTGFTSFFLISILLIGADLFVLVLLIPFMAIGFFLFYYSIGRMRNRRSIVIDQGSLVARESPWPLTMTKRLSVDAIQELTVSASGNWSAPNDSSLDILTKTGKYVAIGRGLSEEQSLLMAQEINDFLGIKVQSGNWNDPNVVQTPGAPVQQMRKAKMPIGAKLFIAFALISFVSIFAFLAIMMSGVFESQESGGLRIANYDAFTYGDYIEYIVTIENTVDTEVTKTLKLTLHYQSGSSDSYESQFQEVTLSPYETRTFNFTIYHYCNGSETVSCSFWNL